MIVKLQGGLGNQMFQYAYGATQARKRREELFLDTSLLEVGNPKREYELAPFVYAKFKNDPSAEEGYWQGEKYFDSDIAWNAFHRDAPIIKGMCFVGVRRGDYLWPERINFHGVMPVEYYREAISLMPPGTEYICVSDDSEWCLDNLALDAIRIHPAIDIRMMSSCEHAIIANSTFHWWGAWLGPDRRGKVVAPKKWFATDVPGMEDIVPDRWIKL